MQLFFYEYLNHNIYLWKFQSIDRIILSFFLSFPHFKRFFAIRHWNKWSQVEKSLSEKSGWQSQRKRVNVGILNKKFERESLPNRRFILEA